MNKNSKYQAAQITTGSQSLADAIDNGDVKPRPTRAARREDTTVDAASLTDADGNRKPTMQYLEAALEAEFRKEGI